MLRLHHHRVKIATFAWSGEHCRNPSHGIVSRSLRQVDSWKWMFFASVAALLLVGSSLQAADETNAPANPTTAEIEAWIRDLDSDIYAERQLAMKNLRRSGVAGIAGLTKAARGSNLEATARAIELLTQLYESPDANVAMAADEALESLVETGPPIAVVRTQQVLATTLGPVRRRHAIAAIKRLGGNIIPVSVLDEDGIRMVDADLNDEGTIQHIVLGSKWIGGLNGIKYLQRLPDLRTMSITKTISLSPEEQNHLRAKLSGVRIDIKSPAYMGIRSGPQVEENCVIEHVVPGSPADRGGLLKGDEVTHVNGMRVMAFAELTGMLADKRGGEIVYVEVHRGDEFLELAITLGEW